MFVHLSHKRPGGLNGGSFVGVAMVMGPFEVKYGIMLPEHQNDLMNIYNYQSD